MFQVEAIERELLERALLSKLRQIMYEKIANDDGYNYRARWLSRKIAGDLAINSYLSYTAARELLSDD